VVKDKPEVEVLVGLQELQMVGICIIVDKAAVGGCKEMQALDYKVGMSQKGKLWGWKKMIVIKWKQCMNRI